MASPLQPTEGISIGALARETGIGVETLRMWERRYGKPQSMRLPSGHRRYDPAEINRLRLATQVMQTGRRPKDIIPKSTESLLRMIGEIENRGDDEIERQVEEAHLQDEQRVVLREWARATIELDESSLNLLLHRDWADLGPLRFLEERAVPFLTHVGLEWERGKITVSQEHFASEVLADFLSTRWRRPSEYAPGKPALLALTPGDLHELGLIMCAVVTALADHRVIYLGPHTPPSQIIETANEHRPVAVCLSYSSCADRNAVRRWTQEIREGVASDIPIAVGGAGAPEAIEGVKRFDTLRAYHAWMMQLP